MKGIGKGGREILVILLRVRVNVLVVKKINMRGC